MLLLDQLRKSDRQLRVIAYVVLSGMLILLSGLWYLQVISSHRYQENLKNQSYRTVRLPAIRGKIMDRQGRILAENRPSFNIHLYLEELRTQFQETYAYNKATWNRTLATEDISEPTLGRYFFESYQNEPESLAEAVQKKRLNWQLRSELGRHTRYEVVSNLVFLAKRPLTNDFILSEQAFRRHYRGKLPLPLPIAENLSFQEVSRFVEQNRDLPGVELEIQPLRVYPRGLTAAHVIGYLKSDDRSGESEEEVNYNYRLPDFRGVTGVEAAFDEGLRGNAGMKSVLVNNMGYRQQEDIWISPQPGQNLVLTLDLAIQEAVEKALASNGPQTQGAAIVMDVNSGDILALASMPSFDPNLFIGGISYEQYERLNDPERKHLFNRATFGAYPPGSIFKIVTALTCLEAGLDPNEEFFNPGYFRFNNRYARRIDDLAPPGNYDFELAFKRSSNTYFIHYGLKAGIGALIEMGKEFQLGRRTGIPTYQEVPGSYPDREDIQDDWYDGDTANLCIGQGRIAVTPLQMTVMTAAIANGGKVLKPRLAKGLIPQESHAKEDVTLFPPGREFHELSVRPHHLHLIRQAMRADVRDVDGTGHIANVPGMNVCGKTGTAEIKRGWRVIDKITWFVSFAPLESPRYAVVVMVESGAWGGTTCAPIARKIYEKLQDWESKPKQPERLTVASLP